MFSCILESLITVSLALCLSALLQAKPVYLAGIVILSCVRPPPYIQLLLYSDHTVQGIPFVNAIFTLVSEIQYPGRSYTDINHTLS
jgi:hypothetical protein